MRAAGPSAALRHWAAGCAGFALFLGLAACARRDAALAPEPVPPSAVWTAIQPRAARYRMDPAFIYALAAAESGFDAHARNGAARGLMQLQPAAWRLVSDEPYEPAVWDWRRNLAAGIDYLAYCRSTLHAKKVFSHPLLLAAFHYGLDYVAAHRYDAGDIPVPDNPLYRELWRGNLAPLPPPPAAAADEKPRG